MTPRQKERRLGAIQQLAEQRRRVAEIAAEVRGADKSSGLSGIIRELAEAQLRGGLHGSE